MAPPFGDCRTLLAYADVATALYQGMPAPGQQRPLLYLSRAPTDLVCASTTPRRRGRAWCRGGKGLVMAVLAVRTAAAFAPASPSLSRREACRGAGAAQTFCGRRGPPSAGRSMAREGEEKRGRSSAGMCQGGGGDRGGERSGQKQRARAILEGTGLDLVPASAKAKVAAQAQRHNASAKRRRTPKIVGEDASTSWQGAGLSDSLASAADDVLPQELVDRMCEEAAIFDGFFEHAKCDSLWVPLETGAARHAMEEAIALLYAADFAQDAAPRIVGAGEPRRCSHGTSDNEKGGGERWRQACAIQHGMRLPVHILTVYLNVCMYVCMCVSMYVRMYVFIYVCAHTHTHTHTSARAHTHTSARAHTHICTRTHRMVDSKTAPHCWWWRQQGAADALRQG